MDDSPPPPEDPSWVGPQDQDIEDEPDSEQEDDDCLYLPPADAVLGNMNGSPHPDSLTVLQHNQDKRGHRTLGHLLSMAEEVQADAICLQEGG